MAYGDPYPTIGTNPDWLQAWVKAWADKTGQLPPGMPQPTPFDPNTDPGFVAQQGATSTQLANLYAALGVTPTFDDKGNVTGFSYGGGQYLQGAQNYGFDEAGNPIAQGDTRYNPFNELEQIKKSFENRKRSTTTSYAAQGQLYSGALDLQRAADATGYAQNYDQLQRSAKGFYSGLVSNALSGYDTGQVNLANAKGTALTNSLLQHANDPPPVPPLVSPKTSSQTTGHTVTTSVKPSTYTKPKGTVVRRIRRRRY